MTGLCHGVSVEEHRGVSGLLGTLPITLVHSNSLSIMSRKREHLTAHQPRWPAPGTLAHFALLGIKEPQLCP